MDTRTPLNVSQSRLTVCMESNLIRHQLLRTHKAARICDDGAAEGLLFNKKYKRPCEINCVFMGKCRLKQNVQQLTRLLLVLCLSKIYVYYTFMHSLCENLYPRRDMEAG